MEHTTEPELTRDEMVEAIKSYSKLLDVYEGRYGIETCEQMPDYVAARQRISEWTEELSK